MAGLNDLLQGLAAIFGTPVPGAPNAQGQASPSTVSYAPAIETALGTAAGLLAPQSASPYGRRTWGGALSNAIYGGLGGYNAAENQLAAQQRAAAEGVMNQQKLAEGALSLKSNQGLMNQYGTLSPEVIKMQADRQAAGKYAQLFRKRAVGATDPQAKQTFGSIADAIEMTGSTKAAADMLGIDESLLKQQVSRNEIALAPLKTQEIQASIAEKNASAAHSGAETGRIGLENEETRQQMKKNARELALPTPEGKEAAFKSMGPDGKLHEHILNPRTGLYEDKGVAEATKAPKAETDRDLAMNIKSIQPKGFHFKSYDPATNSATFEPDPTTGVTDTLGRAVVGTPNNVTIPLPSTGGGAKAGKSASAGTPDVIGKIETAPPPPGVTPLTGDRAYGIEHATGRHFRMFSDGKPYYVD